MPLDRWAMVLIALVIAGGLNAGCRAPATRSPAAAATQAAQQLTAPAATVTNTTTPRRTAVLGVPSSSTPTPTPTQIDTPTPIPPTPMPTETATPSPMPPTSTNTPKPTPSALPSATPQPPTAAPAPPATHTRLPPTPTSSPYRFLPAGPTRPDPSHPCPGCPLAPAYIVGHVHDAAGNPLVGVRLVCYNEWHRYPVVASKPGGEYDFAITQAETTWYVLVLDQADQPISPEVAVRFDPHETCRYILDWRRAD